MVRSIYRADIRNEFFTRENKPGKVYRRLNRDWKGAPSVYVPYEPRPNKSSPHQGKQEIERRFKHAVGL